MKTISKIRLIVFTPIAFASQFLLNLTALIIVVSTIPAIPFLVFSFLAGRNKIGCDFKVKHPLVYKIIEVWESICTSFLQFILNKIS